MSGIYGADVSSPATVDQWRNLKEKHSAQFAIVRCYRSNAKVDENAPQSIKNAWEAGLSWVDVYHFPSFNKSATEQVNESVDALEQSGAKFVRYWFDIEPDDAKTGYGTHWRKSPEENVAFLEELVAAAKGRGLTVGIYTSKSNWSQIIGSSTAFSRYPLWYIDWDNQGSFSDFEPFGGWREPTLKQKSGNETTSNNLPYDGNWCPAPLPGTPTQTPPPPPTGQMTGSEFIKTLPPNACTAREDAILNAVRNGNMAPVSWMEVTNSVGGHTITLFVSADALRIGTADDAVRVSTTPRTMQQIADMLRCVLPTQRICDLIWEQATVTVAPNTMTPDAAMSSTARMVEYDTAVTQKVGGRTGLVENIGKNWCLTNKLAKTGYAANYGWYDKAAPYRSGPTEQGPYHLWQPLATAHNLDHVDYSQVIRLVSRTCVVDGVTRDLSEVLQDPALVALASDEVPLNYLRLPGVAPENPVDGYPPPKAAV